MSRLLETVRRLFKRFARMAKPEASAGPVAFVIGGDPDKKIVIFQFGHAINRLEFSPEEALEIASNIMSRAAIASGKPLEQMVAERQALQKVRAIEETQRTEYET